MHTPLLSLPYLAAGQAQKHVTINETLRMLDALVQLSVTSATITAPPAAPANGECYIVPAGATGQWSGKSPAIATFQDGAWAFLMPKPGCTAYVQALSEMLVFRSGAWQALQSTVNPMLLGINATADATNRLAIKSPASLLDHEGGDHRLKINKSSATATASIMFQQGYSGRAEMGLTGTNRFQIRGSADGTAWTTMLDADPASGRISVAAGPTDPLHVATKGYVDSVLANPPGALTFDYQLATAYSHAGSPAWTVVPGFTTQRVATPTFNTALSRFVAPSAGCYLFIGQIVQTMGASGGSVIGTFGKNGQPQGNWVIHTLAAGALDFMPIQAILALNASDYVEIMINSTVATGISAGYTVFGGTRL